MPIRRSAFRNSAAGFKDIVIRVIAFYISGVNRLTKQERLVLCIVVGLLLTGWAVKAYRTAHLPRATATGEMPRTQTELSQNGMPSGEPNR